MSWRDRILVPFDNYDQLCELHRKSCELVIAASLLSAFVQTPEGQQGLPSTLLSLDGVIKETIEQQRQLYELLLALVDANIEEHPDAVS